MPSTFPNVPFDESLFEANDLMLEYWQRSTEDRTHAYVPDVRAEEEYFAKDILELRERSIRSYEPKEVISQTSETERVREVPVKLHVVSAPTHQNTEQAIVKPLTQSESTMSGGAAIAVIIITLILLYIVIVGVVPAISGSMRY